MHRVIRICLYPITLLSNWIKDKLCPQESKPTILIMPLDSEAQLVVVYNILEGSSFDALKCKVVTETQFRDDAKNEVKTVANIVAKILTDNENIELIYTSVLSNMLHVPSSLRERPN